MRERKNNKKIFIIAGVLVLVMGGVVTFLLFNNKNNNSKETKSVQKEIKEEEKNPDKKVNIVDTNSKTRPYAVMINCHNAALPQAGLDKAYIVYELMVEGGITRMMALFRDVDVNKIGSVRSARTQYLGYVYENDAIYEHAGGAQDALNRIASEGINDIDVDGEYGVRDRNLNRAWEHTLFTTTDLLNTARDKREFRKDTDKGLLLNYSAEEIDLSSYENSRVANNISINYSDYRTSNYKYDPESKTYLRSMNDTPNTDLVTGEQYRVKNILVYGVNYSNYTYSGYSLYQKIDNIGTGEGYYISNGYAVPIKWEKENEKSKTKYKVTSTGKELIVNDGNTYIQIYPADRNLTIN